MSISQSVIKSMHSTAVMLDRTATHYENTPIPDIFHISAQNINCGAHLKRLVAAVLTGTHNLCF